MNSFLGWKMEKYLDTSMTIEIVLKVLKLYLDNACKDWRVKKRGNQTDSGVRDEGAKYDDLRRARSRVFGVIEEEKPKIPATSREMFSKIRDSSRDQLLSLFLTDDEMWVYDARKQLCWRADDPVKCKRYLDS